MAVQKKKYIVYAREVAYYNVLKRDLEGYKRTGREEENGSLTDKRGTFDFVHEEFYVADILEEENK